MSIIATESSVVLTGVELRQITGLSRYRAQARALARMGISYRLRPDGFPLVSRVHFEEIMGTEHSRARAEPKPNWSALDGP